MTLPLVLLVEDNFNFIRTADAFLNSVNVAHPFARDYWSQVEKAHPTPAARIRTDRNVWRRFVSLE